MVTTVPVNLLTVEQRNRIVPSHICLHAYGNTQVKNLGQLMMDLTFDNGVTIPNQDLLVVEEGISPVIGTNVLFPEDGSASFSINKEKLTANLHGMEIDVVTESAVGKSEGLVHSISIEESSSDQIVRPKEDLIIPAKSEMIFPARIDLPPSTTHFMIQDCSIFQFLQCQRYRLPLGKGLYCRNQFEEFPVRVLNPYDRDMKLSKDAKIGRISPVSGENELHVTTNSLEADGGMKTDNRVEAIWSEMVKGDLAKSNEIELKRLIEKYQNIILLNGELPGRAQVEMFRVYPKNKNPVASNFYRTPYSLRPTMRKILDDNCKKGILKRTSSPYNSPTILVKKKDGSWRLVVDYRRINSQIESDSYPLPLIKDLVNQLKHSRVFTSLDLISGYHQVPVHPDSKKLLTIGNELGQYQPEGMPMGPKTAPQHFQRLMNKLFRDVPLSKVIIYLDDLLVHSRSEESHLVQLDQVLSLLQSKNLQCKASKVTVMTREVDFCGHTITGGAVKVSMAKIEAVKKLRTPATAKEAQGCFGLMNYLREMIPNFAEKSKPITRTYSGRFKWTEEAQLAFESIKDEIISGTLKLSIPDCNEDCFVLETDSSNTTMSACLFICSKRPMGVKEVDFHDHGPECLRPVSFWSQNFTPSQCEKYYIREKELTSGRNAMNHFKMYLTGRKFIWWTDNMCLSYANEVRTKKDSVNRKLCEIQAYDFIVQPRSSSQMKVSDCLTRSAVLNQLKISRSDVSKLQQEDPVLSLVARYVQANMWPNTLECDQLRFWRRHRQQLGFGSSGELRIQEESNSSHRILLPSVLEKEMLDKYHDSVGHPGADNTLKTLARHFIWFDMRVKVEDYVRSCLECQADKPNLHPRLPPPKVTDTPSGPFVKISCDLTGPLPLTNRNSRYVFVANDHFSKKIYARAIPDKRSSTTIEALKSIVFENPRLPQIVLSDNGLEFAGEFSAWLKQKNIQHHHSSPYHPQSNGLTERSNATLKSRLKAWKNGNWEEHLREIVHQINLTPGEVTRLTPFAIETGYDGLNPCCPIDVNDTVRQQTISELQKLVRDRIVKEKETRSKKKGRDFVPFCIGDRVLLKAQSGKPKYVGPYEIIEIFSDGYAYQLRSLVDKSECRRRVELLKPFVERESDQRPEEIFEEDPVDANQLGCFGLEDFEIPLAPNGGRMWPISAPPPSDSLLSVPVSNTSVSSVSPSTDSNLSSTASESEAESVSLVQNSEGENDSVSYPGSESPISNDDHILANELELSEASTETASNETVVAAHPELEELIIDNEEAANQEPVGPSVREPTDQQMVSVLNDASVPVDQTMHTIHQDDSTISDDVAMIVLDQLVAESRSRQIENPVPESRKRQIHDPISTVSPKRSKRTEVEELTSCSDSLFAEEETFIGNDQLTSDWLNSLLRSSTESRQLCLGEVSDYELNLIRKKYGVPHTLVSSREEVSKYLLKTKVAGLTVKSLDTVVWAVVPVDFNFDRVHSVPIQSEFNGGYCLNSLGYHGLLCLVIQFRIPVMQFHVHSAESLRKRILEFVTHSDGDLFTVQDGNGDVYLCSD